MNEVGKRIESAITGAVNAYETMAEALPVKVELSDEVLCNIKVAVLVIAVLIILKGVLAK
jgi:hypothetical protein